MTAETPARRPRIASMKARRPDPFVEVAMTAPVFVFYQLGLGFLSVQNGADWITGALLRLFEWNRVAYAAFVLAIGLAMYVVAKRSVRRPAESLKRIVVDSVLFALGLLLTVGLVGRLLVANRVGPAVSVSVLDALILSAGAGFHEELLFRVAGFEGGARLLYLGGLPPGRASVVAALVSSVLFAIAHHLGAFGEPLRLVPFAMRVVSGLYLAAIMRYRGFATAVYTHTLYDVLVMVVLR